MRRQSDEVDGQTKETVRTLFIDSSGKIRYALYPGSATRLYVWLVTSTLLRTSLNSVWPDVISDGLSVELVATKALV